MATGNLTDTKDYLAFSNDVEYQLRVVRARAIAMRALLESQDGYDSNDDLVDLGFLITSVVEDLEGLADKVSDSGSIYTAVEVLHG
jgi:hypothetical protein